MIRTIYYIEVLGVLGKKFIVIENLHKDLKKPIFKGNSVKIKGHRKRNKKLTRKISLDNKRIPILLWRRENSYNNPKYSKGNE